MASESDQPSHPPAPSAPVFTLFIDSNIDTHIALSVPPADTVADVKRKIMIEHMLCFPDVGQVTIQALKVKRRGAFYHLSDTMPVRCAFDGSKGTWFLHADVIAKASSEHQGDNTEHVVDDNNKQFGGDFQLQVKLSEHLNEDGPLNKTDFYIDDNMNFHENQCKLTDHTGFSVPKPMSCQIESLVDMANDQLAAANQNADGFIQSCHLERQEIDKDAQLHALEPIEQEAELPTISNPDMFADQVKGKKLEKLSGSEVLENTISTDVLKEETSKKRSDVEDLHLDSGMASLSLPEELSGNLHDGDSTLMERLTNDKKKRKKKSRSSRSKLAEADYTVPSDNDIRDFFDSAKEQNNEKQPALEKSDVIGFVSDVMKNNNEHSADEDSVPVDTSKRRKLSPDIDNERLPKISESNHFSSMDSMAVGTHTLPVNVTLSSPEELSHTLPDADSSIIEHLTDDKRKKKKRRQSSKSQTDFPIPTDNHVKIFPSIGTEQIMEDGVTSETIETIGFVPEVKVGNNEGTTVDNHKDMINKLVGTTEKASENVVSLKVENSSKRIASTDFSSESMVKGEHSTQISSMAGKMVESDAEKVVFANSRKNIVEEYNVAPVIKEADPFSNTRKKRSRKSLSKDVSNINEPAESANKEKEAPSRDDTAKLELEKPFADNDGKSHSIRTKKSKKSDSKNVPRDVSDINEAAELAINRKEAPDQYDTTKLQSENPCAGDDGKSHSKRTRKSEKVESKKLSKDVPNINEPARFANNQKTDLSQDDTAKVQSENPSADNEGKSCRRRTRQSEKSDSKNLSKDVSDINEPAELANNRKEAPDQCDTSKLQLENPSAGDDGKSHSKSTRKSEKVDSKKLSKDVPDINEPAGFANNRKEALSQDDIAKLLSENPSADNDGKPCRRRTRQSEKSDPKNLSKDVSNANGPAELANNQKEAPDQYDTAKLQSENPSAGDDGKSNSKRTRKSEKVDSKKLSKDVPNIIEPAGFTNNRKEALGHDDTAKLQSEPSADNDGKSCRTRTRQSEKVDSMNFKSGNSISVHSSVNLAKSYDKDKSNQDQQALRDSTFPTKSDDKKSRRKKKKSSNVVLQDNEPHPNDSSNSLVGKSAGDTARLSKEPNPLATDDKAAASGISVKGHDHGKGGASSTILENLTELLPKNIASQGTEESVEAHQDEKFPGVDNNEINFIAVFPPNSIQDEPGVSADQVLPAETKPKKQPKSKRKNKSNKHESAHVFAYPSESEKLDVKKSSTNCGLVKQDSADPSGKSSFELCQKGKEHNDSFNLTADSTRDDGTISSDYMSHVESVKQTIEANRSDTYHQISESQFQNGNHAHYSNEKTFLKSATESHVQVEKEENFNLGLHAVQNQSKPSVGTIDEETHAGLAASSDSTEENTPVQTKRYRLAVRKVPRSMGKKSNNHEPKTSFLIPSAIFDNAVDESSEDDLIFRNSEATAAILDSSSTDSEGSKTPEHHGKHEGSDGEDIFLSQSSIISTKNMPLDTILKSSSSYKKAKLLASQSQADDSESQPVDVVLSTQPEY
ncbi:uncharacterized protein LOC121981558 [Zingiber officinale]|uniref:Uncharacterized protein n=1 Tax=Zingiber officinale TaxID=94328 RepID=A0A8J5LC85_ZINOF|nr:uncharacterized protein LOC121981558 [Zingiber officinale]KAG6508086.1 hypothetical protein ZIOFF_033445 [Zingiber officinale]